MTVIHNARRVTDDDQTSIRVAAVGVYLAVVALECRPDPELCRE
jgi:hypothetical protein